MLTFFKHSKQKRINNQKELIEKLHEFTQRPKGEIEQNINNLLKKYEDIVINQNQITLTTKHVKIKHNERYYHIGKFKISFKIPLAHLTNSEGLSNLFTYKNITNKYLHPHILNRRQLKCSSVCYGNITSLLILILNNKNICSAIHLLDDFLHSYNADSCWTLIERWPSVKIKKS